MNAIRLSAASLALVTIALPFAVSASCGSAFCMVNTDWGVQGVWNHPGARLDLRYEYIDQHQPRDGTRDVGTGEIPRDHDEVSTVNRNFFATLDYGFSPEWGASVTLPWIDRSHRHVQDHGGEAVPESWSFSDLGDVRVIGRYQWPLQGSAADRAGVGGVTFGVKLPTGRTDTANGEGEVAERTLQPGSGTTDALVGGYYRQALPVTGASWFVQASASMPLDRYRDFAPGNQVNVDLGYDWQVRDRTDWRPSGCGSFAFRG